MQRLLTYLRNIARVLLREPIDAAAMILLFVVAAILLTLNFLLMVGLVRQDHLLLFQEATLVVAFPIMWGASKWDLRKERSANPRRVLFERVLLYLMWGGIICVSYIYFMFPSKLEKDDWPQVQLGEGVSIPENDAKFLGTLASFIVVLTKFARGELETRGSCVMWIVPASGMLAAIMMVVSSGKFPTTLFKTLFETFLLSISIGISAIIFGIGREKIYRLPPPIIEARQVEAV
jgi:hypothetical protein